MSKPASDLYEGPLTELVGDPKDNVSTSESVPNYPQRTGNGGIGQILYDDLTGKAPKGKG